MNGRLYQAVQDANRKKDEFLAMLGHELRNPLGAISNAFAILQSGKVPRDTEGSIQAIISRQLRHLRKLVDDLLDVARLTSGKITIDGVDIRDVTIASLRSQIGVVTQQTFLFNDTIKNNIAYGDRSKNMDMIVAAATAAARSSSNCAGITVSAGIESPRRIRSM